MSSVVDYRAHMVAARQLYGRSSSEIVADLRGIARVLLRELETWSDSPLPTAIVSADTSVEGLRRLLGQLRLATKSPPQDAA